MKACACEGGWENKKARSMYVLRHLGRQRDIQLYYVFLQRGMPQTKPVVVCLCARTTGSSVCIDCEAGNYKASAGVNTACDNCQAPKYSLDGVTCADCQAPGYNLVDSTCTPCSTGTYGPTPRATKARIGCHDEGVVTCVALTP